VAAVVEPLTADERKGRVAELEVVGASPEVERRRRDALRAIAQMIDDEIDRAIARGLIEPFEKGMLSLVIAGGTTEALIDHLLTPKRKRRSTAELVDALSAVWLRAIPVKA
jgi:AcrR family transcriptional regulator